MKTVTPLPVYLNTRRVSMIIPPYPTFTLPGTEARIQVMEWRFVNNYSLYHPLDIKDEQENYRSYSRFNKMLEELNSRNNISDLVGV